MPAAYVVLGGVRLGIALGRALVSPAAPAIARGVTIATTISPMVGSTPKGGSQGQATAAGAGAAPASPDPDQEPDSKEKADKPTSVNQMNKQAERGQAPKTVDRADSGKFPGERSHVHFTDGRALYNDGTWKHVGPNQNPSLTRAEANWLNGNGWTLPK